MMKKRSFDFAMFFFGRQTYWDLKCFFFQWRLSIKNIDLIITDIENDFDRGHINVTFKFYEDILPFRVKTGSFNFAMFLYGRRTSWVSDVFQ